MRPSHFFITSTGTSTGKTLVTAGLCHQTKNLAFPGRAFKPVVSGYDPTDLLSDPVILCKAMGLDNAYIPQISPYRFVAPKAPPLAAHEEGRHLAFDDILASSNQFLAYHQQYPCFIEGAGGIASPLTDHHTNLDLIKALKIDLILVVGNYLGTVSHTLTAIETCKHHQLSITTIIISDQSNDNKTLDENLEMIRAFTHIPCLALPYVTHIYPWEYLPPIALPNF